LVFQRINRELSSSSSISSRGRSCALHSSTGIRRVTLDGCCVSEIRGRNRPIRGRRSIAKFATAHGLVTAPPGPSLIINNFPLAAPGLHVYGPCRDRAGLAARVLSVIDRHRERCCLPSSGRYFHGDQSEPAVSPFETRPPLLSIVVLFDSGRAVHASSGNLAFHSGRYNVLDFRYLAPICIVVAGLAAPN